MGVESPYGHKQEQDIVPHQINQTRHSRSCTIRNLYMGSLTLNNPNKNTRPSPAAFFVFYFFGFWSPVIFISKRKKYTFPRGSLNSLVLYGYERDGFSCVVCRQALPGTTSGQNVECFPCAMARSCTSGSLEEIRTRAVSTFYRRGL